MNEESKGGWSQADENELERVMREANEILTRQPSISPETMRGPQEGAASAGYEVGGQDVAIGEGDQGGFRNKRTSAAREIRIMEDGSYEMDVFEKDRSGNMTRRVRKLKQGDAIFNDPQRKFYTDKPHLHGRWVFNEELADFVRDTSGGAGSDSTSSETAERSFTRRSSGDAPVGAEGIDIAQKPGENDEDYEQRLLAERAKLAGSSQKQHNTDDTPKKSAKKKTQPSSRLTERSELGSDPVNRRRVETLPDGRVRIIDVDPITGKATESYEDVSGKSPEDRLWEEAGYVPKTSRSSRESLAVLTPEEVAYQSQHAQWNSRGRLARFADWLNRKEAPRPPEITQLRDAYGKVENERASIRDEIARLRSELDGMDGKADAAAASINAAAARLAQERFAATPRAPSTERTLRTIDMILRNERERVKVWRYFASGDFVMMALSCAAAGAVVSAAGASTFGLGGVALAALAGSVSGGIRGGYERKRARKILDRETAAARSRGDLAEVERLERESQNISAEALQHGMRTAVWGALFGTVGYGIAEATGFRDLIQRTWAEWLPFVAGTGTGAGAAKLVGGTVPPVGGGGGLGVVPPPGPGTGRVIAGMPPHGPRSMPPWMAHHPREPRPPITSWESHCRVVRMRCAPDALLYQRFRGNRCPPILESYIYRTRVPGTRIVECFPIRGPRVGTPFVYDVFAGPRPGNNVWSFMHHTIGTNVRGPRNGVITQYYWEELIRKNPNYSRSIGIVSGRPSLIGQSVGQQVDLRKFFADEEVLRNVLRRPLSPFEQQGIFKSYYDANIALGKRPPLVQQIQSMWQQNPQMRGHNFIPRISNGIRV